MRRHHPCHPQHARQRPGSVDGVAGANGIDAVAVAAQSTNSGRNDRIIGQDALAADGCAHPTTTATSLPVGNRAAAQLLPDAARPYETEPEQTRPAFDNAVSIRLPYRIGAYARSWLSWPRPAAVVVAAARAPARIRCEPMAQGAAGVSRYPQRSIHAGGEPECGADVA